ncbi:hypothetical protein AgCh_027552 [Apium graveolens]
MDVKSAFLNGYLKKEVYVKQPPGFIHEKYPNYVYKLKKYVYGLRQSPRCWYERLSQFLVNNGFIRGTLDPTLFIFHKRDNFLLVQVYVDDIVFGSSNESLCKWFSDCMHKEFDMSLMGELQYFLGWQINQSNAGIFIHQGKYIKDLLKRFALDHVTPKSTPMSTSVKLTKDEQGTPVDVTKFRDADYAGSQVDRKSTSGACEFLGDCLVAWHSKKQTSVALSTAEGEYIAAGSCCAQILWMQQTLQDFGISYSNIPIYCDNTSAINISKNPVMHSRTKHIDVRHHFLRDNVSKGSKRQRVGNFEPEVSSGTTDNSFERHANETTSTKVMSKLILKERLCDLDLLKKIGIVDLFDSVGCSSLLSPPEIIYPELVKEFYAKLRILDGNIVFSEVQGNPVCFKADLLARLTGVSAREFVRRQLIKRFKTFLVSSTRNSSRSFLVTILFRCQSSLRVTFQDCILMFVFVKKIQCNVASLIISNMGHCAKHGSMHLPYPGLLSRVFEYFCALTPASVSDKISVVFDLSVLTLNGLIVSESNELVFDDASRNVGGIPKSPNYASDPFDQPTNTLLNSLLIKLNENSAALASINQHFASIKTLGSLTSEVSILNASFELFRKYVCSSLDDINAKLSVLHTSDVKLSKTIDFEFGTLQEGMVSSVKAWEKEFVKLFFKLGSETKFLSQQLSAMQDKSKMYWHKKRDWIGDCTLEEITAPLPLPAIPPPSAFGMTREEYKAKIFDWLRERDGNALAQEAFDKLFSEYGSTPVFPSSQNKASGSGKGKAPVNVDDDSD